MKKWFKDFFSVSNDVNENTVMGVVFSACAIVATFVNSVPEPKYYILMGMVGLFFGVGAFKK